MRVLAERHPGALRDLERAAPDRRRLSIVDTPSGRPTALLDGVLLHGRRDPARDAGLQARQEIDPEATAVLAIGFGLGYGAEAARAAFPDRPLLVIEPDASVFRAALSCRDLRHLLEDPGLRLYLSPEADGLPLALEALPLARPGYLRLRPALRASPGIYRAAEETIQSWLLRRDINANTLERFGRLWVRNICRNLRAFLEFPGVGSLEGVCSGLPALVVAGGPSLDLVAEHLPALRERMLLVVVNTPLKPCRDRGVEPDFTVVVDPQYWASRYLDWTAGHQGVLVAEPSTCPRALRSEDSPVFLCGSLFPLGETLEAAVGEKGRLGAGGSVSTSAWDLARLLGARPLYAAGLDLGFPGMRSHCRGVYPEDAARAASGRVRPLELWSFRTVREIGLFRVRSAAGGTTVTDRRMLLYKWWFENQLRMRPGFPAFTLSAGGTAIDGMHLARVEDLLALPAARPDIDRRMRRVAALHASAAPGQDQKARLRDALRALESELADLHALCIRGAALSGTLGDLVAARGDPAACLREMDDLDRRILALSSRNVAGFLVQSLIQAVTGQGERSLSPAEVVSRSRGMYEGIAESAQWQASLLARSARELGAQVS
jgi:hypothetical protein